ncbi:unnamed protein product [Nezara viridula]|uniref:Major facilitator superfamily (MFS) profile domain-containing protein n=1 Tax=Nezara viridula TaxID=85310 RepID=A0A9P0E5I4_NEZVI|nr:unnamed protein product [Nezara viridula]
MDPVTLESALEKKCKNHLWLVWLFFLTSTPGIFNSMHITSYVFLGGDPSFSCDIPELVESNWTMEQIIEISSPGMNKQSCVKYDWNYTLLSEMGFDQARHYCNHTEKPEVIKCYGYIFDEETKGQTIVSQWDLVCDNLPLRSTAQVGVAIGKFFGAFIFGLFADRFGRKKIFCFSCFLYMVAGPAGALVNDYLLFIILRILVGVAGSGVYEAGYTILSELTVKHYRAYLGCLYNVSYSVGLILLPLAAYFTNNWQQLQLAISVPTIFLLIHCWYLPESPRWLITRGKLEKASIIIGSKCCLDFEGNAHHQKIVQDQNHPWYKKVIIFLKNYFMLFSTFELTKRILICYLGWFVGNLYYYVIALNGANFTVNEYLYVGLNGICEVPGYTILPLVVLTYYGRRSAGIALFTVSGIAVLIIMFVPQGWPVMSMAMIGRLTVSAVFSVIILQTSELFPTEHRNTAVGSSLTVAQFGTMAAPYIVDILGKKIWWIPTTLCGVLSLLCAFVLFFIPETRDTPMLDTLSEMNQGKESHTNDTESAS